MPLFFFLHAILFAYLQADNVLVAYLPGGPLRAPGHVAVVVTPVTAPLSRLGTRL